MSHRAACSGLPLSVSTAVHLCTLIPKTNRFKEGGLRLLGGVQVCESSRQGDHRCHQSQGPTGRQSDLHPQLPLLLALRDPPHLPGELCNHLSCCESQPAELLLCKASVCWHRCVVSAQQVNDAGFSAALHRQFLYLAMVSRVLCLGLQKVCTSGRISAAAVS